MERPARHGVELLTNGAPSSRHEGRGGARSLRMLVALLVAVGLVVAAFFLARSMTSPPGALEVALSGRGRVLVRPGSPWLGRDDVPGTHFLAASGAVEAALGAEDDGTALAEALRSDGAFGIFLTASLDEGASVRHRLANLGDVPAMRGVVLTPSEALYAPSVPVGGAVDAGRLLAEVARGILDSRSPPPLALFPEELRAERSVEVMVLLRENGTARLWRSARGGSIASALIVATTRARDRWRQRTQAMGGRLSEKLPLLQVEVSLLEEDGTLTDPDPAFLERAFTPAHGVAYERQRSWHYELPAATRRAGSVSAAYESVLEKDGNTASLDEADIRLYRLRVVPLGTSRPRREASLPSPRAPRPTVLRSRGATAPRGLAPRRTGSRSRSGGACSWRLIRRRYLTPNRRPFKFRPRTGSPAPSQRPTHGRP